MGKDFHVMDEGAEIRETLPPASKPAAPAKASETPEPDRRAFHEVTPLGDADLPMDAPRRPAALSAAAGGATSPLDKASKRGDGTRAV